MTGPTNYYMTTFHICPECGIYWTPDVRWTDGAEGRVRNGGARRCADCARTQARHDDARADARYEH